MVFVGDFSEYEVVVVRATVTKCEKSGNTVVESRCSVSFLSTQTQTFGLSIIFQCTKAW